MEGSTPNVRRGRLCIVVAALLWSTSSVFTKILTKETPLGLEQPAIEGLAIDDLEIPVQLACYRVLFAGLVLLPLVRPRDVAIRPLMLFMALAFAVMNALFVTALALGTAANAILLQYTAPMWMYLAGVFLLREPADRRSSVALIIALTGVLVIVLAGDGDEPRIILIALVSGFAYAWVVTCLRALRQHSSQWLTSWNFLISGLVLLPFVLPLRPPTAAQFVVLFLYGAAQMALPYWLMARGLRSVGPVEAGMITLIEPLLNPLWAYLVSGEVPAGASYVGGTLILAALVWRYWPRKTTPVRVAG